MRTTEGTSSLNTKVSQHRLPLWERAERGHQPRSTCRTDAHYPEAPHRLFRCRTATSLRSRYAIRASIFRRLEANLIGKKACKNARSNRHVGAGQMRTEIVEQLPSKTGKLFRILRYSRNLLEVSGASVRVPSAGDDSRHISPPSILFKWQPAEISARLGVPAKYVSKKFLSP